MYGYVRVSINDITDWDKKFNDIDNNNNISFKHISANLLKKIEVKNGSIRLLSTGNFVGYTNYDLSKEFINKGEVITIPSGGSANIKYFKGEFVDSGNILCCSIDEKLLCLKYLYYFLKNKNDELETYYRGSSVKHPEMKKILGIYINLPTLEKQKEIVKKLDTLDKLCNDLNEGLPAEIEARKKQYEYYRDKLLSFK